MIEDNLVAGLRAGDAQALAVAYDRYAGLIYRLACRALGADGAEEVVQEAFVRLWRNAQGFDARRGNFERWFTAIARNCVIDEIRRRRASGLRLHHDEAESLLSALPDRGEGPEDRAWRNEVSNTLAVALNKLPAEQRQVIALAYYGGYSQSEIATRLGIPLGTVKKRIKLGMDKLRVSVAGKMSLESAS